MNKKPSFAGSLYPSEPQELNKLLNSYKEQKKVVYKSTDDILLNIKTIEGEIAKDLKTIEEILKNSYEND